MSDVKLIHNDVNDSIALSITEHHKTVSNIDTPKYFVKNKMGADYVEYSYMREIADKHYPGWSWNIIKSEALGSEAYVVQGRLRWFDNGIWREGDAVADDVYRNRVEDLTLTEDEIESIMTSVEYIQDSEIRDKIKNSIKRGEILKTDYKKVMNYIEKIKKGEVNE